MVGFLPMRAVARLTLVYFAAFIFFLAAGTSVSVMRTWLEANQSVSVAFSFMSSLFASVADSIPLAAYGAALLTLPTTTRRFSGYFLHTIVVFILTGAALFSLTYGMRFFTGAAAENAGGGPSRTSFAPGRILDFDSTTIVFAGPAEAARDGLAVQIKEADALRIISAPEANQRFESSNPSRSNTPYSRLPSSISSLSNDFSACARRLAASFAAGIPVLLAYSCALALMLASCGVLSGVTRWPLADLAFCALAFRGVLIFDELVSAGPLVRFFLKGNFGIPEPFIAPAVLGACGAIVFVLGFLMRLALGRTEKHG